MRGEETEIFGVADAGGKLIVLPGIGHMIQNAVPDLVVSEIEAMIGKVSENARAAGG